MEPDEILTILRFPVWAGRCGFAVEELARRHGDFALAGAVCAIQLDAAGQVLRCGIGLLGMGSTPIRAVAAEAAIVGTDPGPADLAEIARLGVSETDPPTDLHASSEYRAAIGQEMVRRVLERAIEGARR
jgi:carbon-monoxide dehydrogenase medium subunit